MELESVSVHALLLTGGGVQELAHKASLKWEMERESAD